MASLVVVLTACAGASHSTVHAVAPATFWTTTTAARTTTSTPHAIARIVALGDSVPSGTACGCAPYPVMAASAIGGAGVDDDAVAGYRTTDVLTQLTSDTRTIEHVREADAVLIEVGANDVSYTPECGASYSCYAPELDAAGQNVLAIVTRVRQLTADRPVTIVLLDYWNVWLGGKYAQAKGAAYVQTADALTLQLRDAIRSIAAAAHTTYADVRVAFRGPDDDQDETPLLAPDGDHPNAAGHQRIADAVVRTLDA